MYNYNLVTSDSDIACSDFTLIKIYSNEELLTEYNTGFEKVFHQMCLDIPRQDIYLDETKANCISDILYYISSNPYLKCNQLLVYLFLSQTMLSIPTLLISDIISNINNKLVVSSTKRSRTNIIVFPYNLLIQIKLSGVIPTINGDIQNVLDFDISIDVDLVGDETFMYISCDNSI